MKFRKLLMMIPVFALAACGSSAKTLTLEEAQERANQILTAQETIELPESYSYSTSMVMGDGEQSIEAKQQIVVADHFYFYSYEQKMSVGGESMTGEVNVHVYAKNNEVTMAFAVNEGEQSIKQYTTIAIPEGESVTTEEIALSGAMTAASVMGSEDYEDYLLFEDDFFGSTIVLEGVGNLYLSDEDAEAYGFSSYECVAKSKGEGHLNIEVNAEAEYTEEGVTTSMVTTEKEEWTNNLSSSYYSSTVITETTADVANVLEMVEEYNLKHSAKPSYPNLSGYNLVEPELA